jgi:uncharacterized OB-fold protein
MTTDAIETRLGDWVHKPLVGVDPDLQPFWAGLRDHEFKLCRCSRCGAHYFPYTVCNRHEDIPDFDEMEWVPTSGRGCVFAKVVVHQVADHSVADELPYVLSMVELEEGPIFPARLVDCDPERVKIDDPVEVVYLDSPRAGHTLPFFRPATR